LSDFNIADAFPILMIGTDFVLLQWYSLAQSLYESPFFWIESDRQYAPSASANRGHFTERFCRERLESVFGQARVHQNVRISESKSTMAGEIDVLVFFGDRAIIVQAKSKRLTLEARKGSDLRIRDDFAKGVQAAYDQGLACAQRLAERKCKLVSPDGANFYPLDVSRRFTFCVSPQSTIRRSTFRLASSCNTRLRKSFNRLWYWTCSPSMP
jgi:hypothetical protein